MKNILKIFALISGLSWCMMANQMSVIEVTNSANGASVTLEVPVSPNGECRASDVIAALYATENLDPTEQRNKVIPHYVILNDSEVLLPNDICDPKSGISFVNSMQQVTIPIKNGDEATVTIVGNLSEEFATEFNEFNLKIEDISLEKLLQNSHTHNFIDFISVHMNTVITSSGQVFKKEPSRCNLPAERQHTAIYLFQAIMKNQDLITQEKINTSGPNILQAWVLS